MQNSNSRRGVRIGRRQFILNTLAGGALLTSCRTFSAKPVRPNILLITADDLGTQLSCYGDTQIETPHIDQLAAEGVRFTRGYVTHASCSPSRSTLFTGLYPHQSGHIGNAPYGYRLHPGTPILPQLLRDAGYRTGVIGKIHVAPMGPKDFDWTPRGGSGRARNVRTVAEDAAAFLDSASETPFFLMVNYTDPHRNRTEFIDQAQGLPETPLAAEDLDALPFLLVNDAPVRAETAGYYNCVARLDAGIGMLMDALRRSGMGHNTLVVFIGDHGPPFVRAKTSVYEAGLHIPYIVKWPGRAEAGQVCDALVSTVDLFPTFLESAGVSLPGGLPGSSLAPLMHGKPRGWRETLCAEFTAHGPRHFYPRRSIRDERYKLIHNLLYTRENPLSGIDGDAAWPAAQQPKYDGTIVRRVYDTYKRPPEYELYDLDEDPHETRNLAGEPGYAETLGRLRRHLAAWQENTQDPLRDPEELARLTRLHDELRREKRRAFKNPPA